jgi:hypothetical protein
MSALGSPAGKVDSAKDQRLLALLRNGLCRLQLKTAAQASSERHRQPAHATGLVTSRKRQFTASCHHAGRRNRFYQPLCLAHQDGEVPSRTARLYADHCARPADRGETWAVPAVHLVTRGCWIARTWRRCSPDRVETFTEQPARPSAGPTDLRPATSVQSRQRSVEFFYTHEPKCGIQTQRFILNQ